jgi:succinyl-CoA synthetase beta subunit
LKIHEYQAKQLLRLSGVPVPDGELCETAEEARRAAEKMMEPGKPMAVKAQVHAGGRGKGGGIKLVRSADEAEQKAREMIGSILVTPQTGPEGTKINKVLLEQGVDIAAELYAGITFDRASRKDAFMVSTEGGVEIEKVAAETPEKIHKAFIDPVLGMQVYQARALAYALGLEPAANKAAVKVFLALYEAYRRYDASLAEINPLVVTSDKRLLALDGKMIIDDNGLFRHADLAEMRDIDEEAQAETEARKYGLSYIKLEGDIGCMVNGAGLAMTSMDIVKLFGGEPANFLDIGGGAGADKVAASLRIILSDPNVKAVLFNIFGGITRCDEVARGILDAMAEVKPHVPMVVRLVGTNAEEGRKLLADAKMITAETLADAAKKAVAAAKGKAS